MCIRDSIQVVSAAVQEKFGLRRRLASLIATGVAGVASVFVFSTTNGLNALDVVDKFINELGIVTAAIVMTGLITFVAKKLPELRHHLNYYSSIKIGSWWYALVGVVTPAILTVTLVLTAYSLITEGYDSYPQTFVYQYGWFMIVAVVFISFILSFVPWRTNVDDYDPVAFHDAGASLTK